MPLTQDSPQGKTWCMPPTRPPMPDKGPGVQARLPGCTVLVVEDSRFSADAMRMLLRASGARMRRAESLCDARRHLALYRPEAVLVDMGLPDGSGATLIRDLRVQQGACVHIVATSGHPEMEHPALEAGADDFLPKPVETLAQFQRAFQPVMPWLHSALTGRMAALPRPDPLALRDDFARAAHALRRIGDKDTLAYTTRFVGGLARCTGDTALRAVAEAAELTNRSQMLARALQARIDTQPTL